MTPHSPTSSGRAAPRPTPRAPSLRTELLLNLAVLAFATLVCAVAGVLLLFRVGEPAHAALWIALLVLLDVAVFVAFGAYLLRRLVLRPLADTLAAAEAIAGGDLARRVPAGGTREFQRMARSVNRMTDRLLEEHAHRLLILENDDEDVHELVVVPEEAVGPILETAEALERSIALPS